MANSVSKGAPLYSNFNAQCCGWSSGKVCVSHSTHHADRSANILLLLLLPKWKIASCASASTLDAQRAFQCSLCCTAQAYGSLPLLVNVALSTGIMHRGFVSVLAW